jgi:hypothetical protein
MKVFPSLKARASVPRECRIGNVFLDTHFGRKDGSGRKPEAQEGTNSGFSIPEQAREVYRSGKSSGRVTIFISSVVNSQ